MKPNPVAGASHELSALAIVLCQLLLLILGGLCALAVKPFRK